MIFRRLVAACSALIGFACLCLAAVWGTSDRMIEETIANSHRIEALFKTTAAWVDDFKRRHGRLPAPSELEAWKATQPKGTFSVEHVHLIPPGEAGDLSRPFAAAPPGAYVLSYWRGEGYEYYASWIPASTLMLEKRQYHITGSGILDGLVAAVVGALLIAAARRVWPTRRA